MKSFTDYLDERSATSGEEGWRSELLAKKKEAEKNKPAPSTKVKTAQQPGEMRMAYESADPENTSRKRYLDNMKKPK